VAAARVGAHIADVKHPGSALGTPYPLNIKAARDRLNAEGFERIPISTNIGEQQPIRSTACQAALGVAIAGADYVKCGFAGLNLKAATYLGRNLVRTLKEWCPESKVYPAVFPDEEFAISFDPLVDGPALVEGIDCDGLLIDTFNKQIGRGLLDYYQPAELKPLVDRIHALGKQAWLAGSLAIDDLPALWEIGTDVVCIRGAACDPRGGDGRHGEVTSARVEKLVATLLNR